MLSLPSDPASVARRRHVRVLALAGVALLLSSPAWAAGGGTAMPWETPLETIMQSLFNLLYHGTPMRRAQFCRYVEYRFRFAHQL